MVAEERLEKAIVKIKSLESGLTNAQNQVQGLQTVLEQEKIANINLKTELDKTKKLKEVLEEQLKDALVPTPSLPAK